MIGIDNTEQFPASICGDRMISDHNPFNFRAELMRSLAGLVAARPEIEAVGRANYLCEWASHCASFGKMLSQRNLTSDNGLALTLTRPRRMALAGL